MSAAAAEFDYVIAGGGTAGCILAARLSEDPRVSVCMLEAGDSDAGNMDLERLERWMELLYTGPDWGYDTEPQEAGNSFVPQPRAKVLGGCSTHNAGIAFWPLREDLDEWAELGCAGWGAGDCLPLMREVHARVEVRIPPPDDPSAVALLEAAAAAGLPTLPFNTGATVANGAGWVQLTAREDNTRVAASTAYLHPVLGRRPNLEVRTRAWCSRILLEEGRRAAGVEYLTEDMATLALVRARREVIVCCGAIDTPKLLMLSGIGPGEHLREHGIGVVVDAPGVGANLRDHPEGVVQWEGARELPPSSTQSWPVAIFSTLGAEDRRPALMMHYGSVPFDLHTRRHGYPTAANGFALTPNVCRPRSSGTVRLRTRDFRDRPRIDPRWFTDPESHDMDVMVGGLRLARELVARAPMDPWRGRELTPGPDAVSDDELIDYTRRTHNSVYHPACTARMGPDGDPGAVLDARLRVRGVAGLRVADASALPALTAVNPCLTVMMVGEKAARLVAEEAA